MFRRIVKAWATAADLDPRRFSGHSTRRTKPTLLYTKTRDVKACAQILGHQNLGHTIAYIGADTKAALDLADTVTF
jgi:integrase